MTIPVLTAALQMGQGMPAVSMGSAHNTQQHMCPHGWKISAGSAAQQTMQPSEPLLAFAFLSLLCARLLLRDLLLPDSRTGAACNWF